MPKACDKTFSTLKTTIIVHIIKHIPTCRRRCELTHIQSARSFPQQQWSLSVCVCVCFGFRFANFHSNTEFRKSNENDDDDDENDEHDEDENDDVDSSQKGYGIGFWDTQMETDFVVNLKINWYSFSHSFCDLHTFSFRARELIAENQHYNKTILNPVVLTAAAVRSKHRIKNDTPFVSTIVDFLVTNASVCVSNICVSVCNWYQLQRDYGRRPQDIHLLYLFNVFFWSALRRCDFV